MRDKNIKLISPETSWACKHGGWPQNFFALCSRLFSHESPQIMWISRLEQSRLARWNVSPRVVSFEVPQQQMHTCVTTSKANIPVILIFFSPSPFPLDDSSQIMHTISSAVCLLHQNSNEWWSSSFQWKWIFSMKSAWKQQLENI